MNKLFSLISFTLIALSSNEALASGGLPYNSFRLAPQAQTYDAASDIPPIDVPDAKYFEKIPDAAQYQEADWSTAIGIARSISLSDAYKIANGNPEITFFFYTKGERMMLKTPEGKYRIFHQGDAVFFTGKPWWGSASGLSDGYVKKQ